MATIDKNFIPPMAVHPCEIIEDERKARGLKKKELAERLGMQAPNYSSFIKEQKTITPTIANKLEEALGIPATEWLNLQAQYERDTKAIEARTQREELAARVEHSLLSIVNLRILLQYLGIVKHRAYERIEALWSAFRVGSHTELLALCNRQGCYKKSEQCNQDEIQMNTWLLMAHLATRGAEVSISYQDGNAIKAAQDIAKAIHRNELNEEGIKSILNSYGIGYAVVKKLDKVPVDGYSCYSNKPCIITTHRYNDLHKLVFVVLHELGHIHLHLQAGDTSPFISDMTESHGKQEEEANAFARDILIPQATWRQITSAESLYKITPQAICNAVQSKAIRYGISPQIALYRYQYESNNYKLQRPRAVPIT